MLTQLSISMRIVILTYMDHDLNILIDEYSSTSEIEENYQEETEEDENEFLKNKEERSKHPTQNNINNVKASNQKESLAKSIRMYM